MKHHYPSPKRSLTRLLLAGAIATTALSIGAATGSASAAEPDRVAVVITTPKTVRTINLPITTARSGIRW